MSNVKLNSSGGGSVTVSAPVTASNYTVTLPAATSTLIDTTSTQTLTNKTLTAAGSNSVEATSGPTSSQLAGNRNKIINGRMEINQRGVTSGVISGYFVDRWAVTGVSTSSLITSSLPTEYTQALSVNRTSAAGTMTAYQRIEAANCFDLVGASATVSFWAQNVTGLSSISVTLSYATAVNNFTSITSISTVTVSSSPSASWTYYTATFSSLPAGAANGLQLAINGTTASTGTLGITGVQLEKGATATPFENRLYGTELALCQRYYYKWAASSAGDVLCNMSAYNTTAAWGKIIDLPVEMRSVPTGTVVGSFRAYPASGSGGVALSVKPISLATKNALSTGGWTGSSGLVAGYCTIIDAGSSTSYVEAAAEL